MPLPKTSNVGKVIAFLKKEKPEMDKKQMIATALKHTGKSNDNKKGIVEMAIKMHKNG